MSGPHESAIEDLLGETDCLTKVEIRDYVGGKLIASELHRVEVHLIECPLCADAVEGARLLSPTELAVFGDEPRGRMATPVWWKYAVGMAAAVLISFGVYRLWPGAQSGLFDKHFSPYPNATPLVRGSSTVTDMESAMTAYEAGDYQGAYDRLHPMVEREPQDSDARFYRAMCLLALDRTEEALEDLNRVTGPLMEPAQWYRALAHLKLGDLERAHDLLEQMANGSGFYVSKARAVLSEIHPPS